MQREKIDMERDAEKQRRELTQLREEFEVLMEYNYI